MSPQSRRRTLPLATALLALTLTAPALPALAAGTTSAESPAPTFPSAVLTRPGALTQSADIHAPLALAAAKAQQQQDLRHLNAGGSYTPGAIPAVSYPSGGAYTPGATPAVSYPRPVAPAHAVQAPDSSGGVSPTTIGLGIAGSLLLVGGVAAVARRNRRIQRTRVTA